MNKSSILPISDPKDIIKEYPDTKEYIENNRIHAFVVSRVGNYGFILIIENNISRMWQDNDLVLIYFASAQLKNKLDK